jgi:hypothetical protein
VVAFPDAWLLLLRFLVAKLVGSFLPVVFVS